MAPSQQELSKPPFQSHQNHMWVPQHGSHHCRFPVTPPCASRASAPSPTDVLAVFERDFSMVGH